MRIIFLSTLASVAIWSGLSTGTAHAQEAAPPRARVLVVLPADETPLLVQIYTRWDHAFAMMYPGTLQTSIKEAMARKRDDPMVKQFNETMAGFERTPCLSQSLQRAFSQIAKGKDVFDLTFSQDRDRYFDDDKLKPQAKLDGYGHVLIINEKFLGLASNNTHDPHRLVPALNADYALFDATSRKSLEYGSASAAGLDPRPKNDAVRDRAQFELLWPQVCGIVTANLSNDLMRKDHLHAIAAAVGRGDEVPAIKTVLAAFAKRFKWNMKPAKGWTTLYFFDSKFMRGIAPKNAELNLKMGFRIDVDPLAAEFDTAGMTVEQYRERFEQRWRTSRPADAPFERFADVDVPGHEAFATTNPAGERYIFLFRKLDESLMQVTNLIFLKEFDSLYPAHRADLEAMARNSTPLLVKAKR